MEPGMAAWCRRWLGAEPVEVLFRAGYLSAVTGLRLADGRRVLVKARRPAERLPGRPGGPGRGRVPVPPAPGRAGRAWTPAERQACWAAGLWVRVFNAKKQRMGGGGPHLDRLAGEVGERMARAGLQPPPGSG